MEDVKLSENAYIFASALKGLKGYDVSGLTDDVAVPFGFEVFVRLLIYKRFMLFITY